MGVEAVHRGDREATLETIADQSEELSEQDARGITVTCPCGASGPVTGAYRCLYCDVWFCPDCADAHFDG